MKRVLILLVLATCLLGGTCVRREFGVRMEITRDNQIHREITVQLSEHGQRRPDGPADLERLKSIYGKAIQSDSGRHTFAKEFSHELPPDMEHEGFTNHGHVARTSSRVGCTMLYFERMPGRTNLLELARAATHFADVCRRILLAYAQQHPELKHEPQKLAALTTFCQTEFRQDLENAMLLAWVSAVQAQFAAQQPGSADNDLDLEAALRLVDFLVERGYLRGADVALLEDNSHEVLARGVVRKFATVLGHAPDEPLPPALAKLLDGEEFQAAFNAGRAAIGMSEEEFNAIIDSFGFELFGDTTGVEVVWSSPTKPVRTNGEWDEKARELRWRASGAGSLELPRILHATWVEPNEEFQRLHFGQVILSAEELIKYNAWRRSLAPRQAEQWDAFVDSLEPVRGLADRIRSFRFAPSAAVSPSSDAERLNELPVGVELLLSAVRAKSP